MALSPPSTCLPPIRSLYSRSATDIRGYVAYLRQIYCPEVRGSRRSAKGRPDETDLQNIRADSFERSFAIQWLTALISQLQGGLLKSDDDSGEIESLVDEAAALVALCSGAAATGAFVRTFVFDLGAPFEGTVQVDVNDAPLESQDFSSVGAQTWGGSCILAERIAQSPPLFRINQQLSTHLRILELGAGTGLVSLVVGKILEITSPHPDTRVIATDFHSSVLTNLRGNVSRNHLSPDLVKVVPLDWSKFCDSPTKDEDLLEPYDLILGADIIYEAEHAQWIYDCLRILLRKPSPGISRSGSTQEPLFHLIIPLRPTHREESSTVEQVFPMSKGNLTDGLVDEEELALFIVKYEDLVYPAYGDGEHGDVHYRYFHIGWRPILS
ncbi:hypothetical protein SISSUDRAFT_1056672 [Sistotremastrum suecicum HHB10207 ss-3]|uniref:S-adenosyl-L-methionine-dependent methyltransferase n=1 Tax=Sistotremastrum suecicum HHB10207 ss-3 TaxID=1314776 RepID=A0A166J2Q1_9AGAM|nr:hypothetical protein SISSUDRAFT_1056672 [Sistotremastrum suecicum HHB10207 ss-3]